MIEHPEYEHLPMNLAALAQLLDQYATGPGRITPRPRGARMSPEVRANIEAAVTAAGNDVKETVSSEYLLVFFGFLRYSMLR